MLIPRDHPVYESLNTSFTDFGALLKDLGRRQLSGCLEVVSEELRGAILFAAGQPLNAYADRGGQRVTGIKAADVVAHRGAAGDAVLNVYALSPALAELIAQSVDGELVYGGLSTAFTSLDRLLEKLQQESHSGYLELELASGGQAAILLANGAIVDAACWAADVHSLGRGRDERDHGAGSLPGSDLQRLPYVVRARPVRPRRRQPPWRARSKAATSSASGRRSSRILREWSMDEPAGPVRHGVQGGLSTARTSTHSWTRSRPSSNTKTGR